MKLSKRAIVCGVFRGASPERYDYVIVTGERVACSHQSVAGAALLGLQTKFTPVAARAELNFFGFVPNDGENIFRRHNAGCGRNHVGQQRLASNFM